jgi:hypothetical protein
MRAALEALLRAKKLDATLTSASATLPPERLAATGWEPLDAALSGGLRRGHVSEIAGAPSTGRTSLMLHALAAAVRRGEVAALVDACDTFDPESAAALGVDLARVLWVRESHDPTRALKAFSLILQAGGFGLVVLDLADVQPAALRQFPWTTWMRVSRIIEGSDTVALLVGRERIARSPGGVTIALDAAVPAGEHWAGASDRARVFAGIAPVPRVVSARS